MAGHFPPTLRPQRHASRSPVNSTEWSTHTSFGSLNAIKQENSGLDLTQRLEKKLAEYNASDNVFKRWILELSSWTISALCLGAVVGIHLHINGQSMVQSELLLAWTNALGKIASAALIIPTSEALGQLKWNWFHESRAMWDFEIFDKASRGPWGAVMLLFRTKGRSLAALGALIVVLLLAIDTFLQQVVKYEDNWIPTPDLSAKIPRIVHYEPHYTREFKQHEEQAATDKAMAAVLREYFYGNGTQPVPFGNGTRPDIPLSCPTSNCKWEPYESLAVCSRCDEVSQALDISHNCLYTIIDWSTNWTGPIADESYPNGTVCGYYLNATSENPILLSGYLVSNNSKETSKAEALLTRLIPLTDFDTKEPLYGGGSIHFKNIHNPLLDALVASAPNGVQGVYGNELPLVHECILSWCIQTIQSSYEWGVYSENVTSEYLDTTYNAAWPWESYEVETGIFMTYAPNISLQSPSTCMTFGADNVTVFNIMLIFDDLFPATYTAADAKTLPLLRYKNYGEPSTRTMDFNPWQAPNNLTHYMERLAAAMTNLMRSSTSKEYVEGEVYARAAMVSVNWVWLIFPFTLLFLSLAFLVSTMIKTSKDSATGIWKTSAMPSLIYGLPEETRGKFTTSSTWNRSQGDSKKVRIRLLPELGWRVSSHDLLQSPLLPVKKNQPPPGWI